MVLKLALDLDMCWNVMLCGTTSCLQDQTLCCEAILRADQQYAFSREPLVEISFRVIPECVAILISHPHLISLAGHQGIQMENEYQISVRH